MVALWRWPAGVAGTQACCARVWVGCGLGPRALQSPWLRIAAPSLLVSQCKDVCVQRLQPRRDSATGATEFAGWSRMAARIVSFVVVEIARPRVGEVKPASVTAELVIDLADFRRGDVRSEWDELKEHDVLFLLTVQPPSAAELQALADAGETGIAATGGLKCAPRPAPPSHTI